MQSQCNCNKDSRFSLILCVEKELLICDYHSDAVLADCLVSVPVLLKMEDVVSGATLAGET